MSLIWPNKIMIHPFAKVKAGKAMLLTLPHRFNKRNWLSTYKDGER